MDSENVKNQEQNTADQTTGNSESYGRAAGNYQKEYRSVTNVKAALVRQQKIQQKNVRSVPMEHLGCRVRIPCVEYTEVSALTQGIRQEHTEGFITV